MRSNGFMCQNDMLQWHLEHPALDNTSLYMIAKRILLMNLGAIHTSSNVRSPMLSFQG